MESGKKVTGSRFVVQSNHKQGESLMFPKWVEIPSELLTPRIIKPLLHPDVVTVRLFGRTINGVELDIHGTYDYRTPPGSLKPYLRYDRTASPVWLSFQCGVSVPLDINTPIGVVADYLFDHGHEGTDVYRLLMWFHNLGSGS